MAKAKEIISKIEEFAPLSLQEEYDNSGLQIGDINTEVTGIYIALNLDLEVLKDAKNKKCNFILTHHPVLFHPLSQIDTSTYFGKVIEEAIKNDFIVYSSHTSCDNAEQSIAYTNLTKLGCTNIQRFDELYIADIDLPLREILKKLTIITGDENILSTNLSKDIKKVGYINGSGGRMEEILPVLLENKVDCYISSEFKYSFLLDLTNNNIEVLELNHFNSERVFNEIMKNKLCTNFENVVI